MKISASGLVENICIAWVDGSERQINYCLTCLEVEEWHSSCPKIQKACVYKEKCWTINENIKISKVRFQM